MLRVLHGTVVGCPLIRCPPTCEQFSSMNVWDIRNMAEALSAQEEHVMNTNKVSGIKVAIFGQFRRE